MNQVVINLAREMEKSSSYDPIVLICDWAAVNPIWEEIHGIKTLRWRIRPLTEKMNLKERFLYKVWESRFRAKFKQLCLERNIKVINPHYPGSATLTLERVVRSLEKPIPMILSFHGNDLSSIKKVGEIGLSQWKALLSRGQKIVVCSSDLGRKVKNIFGENVNLHVVHNGLDVPSFVATAASIPRSTQRNILSVAKFEHKKGQDILVSAFAAIADDYRDVILILVGASDRALKGLQDLCVEKRIAEKVLFFPDVPHHQVAGFFKNATIFVLPSRTEPFGIVILEAGAFSLPVVASRTGGVTEILTDGLTGRIVEAENITELEECLRSMLDCAGPAKDMGARLKKHICSNFTWTAAHQKYIALI
ncbi:MAG: glycosyltransferase family 4 protein [Glaciimonas sp.]|nr:glycosyltransferase family 4 protein [Glaciimonas sp.]